MPWWFDFGGLVFLTICAKCRGADPLTRGGRAAQLWETVVHRERVGVWTWRAGVIMPDHMHLLVSLPDVSALPRTVAAWKRHTARNHGVHWQPSYFDRRLRNRQSIGPTIEYIRQNPVRAGLVSRPDDWPYLWVR